MPICFSTMWDTASYELPIKRTIELKKKLTLIKIIKSDLVVLINEVGHSRGDAPHAQHLQLALVVLRGREVFLNEVLDAATVEDIEATSNKMIL